MTNEFDRLSAVSNGQLGSFTRVQAHAAGLSDDQLRRRVHSGFLVQIGPNAFRGALAPPSVLADLHALVLDIGAPCWVSGPTAAALWALDGFTLHRPFHVTVPRGRDLRRLGHVIHTSIEMPAIDAEEVQGIPVTRAARTIIDLAHDTPPARLTAALDAAMRDGLLTEDALHRRIVALRSSGRYGIPKLLDVVSGVEVTRGGHSWLEREFLQVLARAGIRTPMCQQVLAKAGERMVRVDCRFEGTPIVVELLGYRFHRSKAQLQRDAARVNALALEGYLVLQFTYEDVVTRPDHVVAVVRRAIESVSAIKATDPMIADTSVGPLRGWWERRPSRGGRRPS